MYAPAYGAFAHGGAGSVSNAPSSGYNPNMPSAPPSAQQQMAQPPPPQQQQQHQQHQQQHQQHMMFNPNQFGPAGGAAHQSPYGAMGGNPGMMQSNSGMAHMPPNNGLVQGYQTPYGSSPYGAGMQNPTGAPNLQQQYMAPNANAASFGMNMGSMTPQQPQRMQAPPISTPNPSSQRVSPYGGASQSTPPQAQLQSQFMTPQNPPAGQPNQVQTPTSSQTPTGQQNLQGQIPTPQTPNFPANPMAGGGSNTGLSTPLSPGSESRERERVSLLLDINRELLQEVMRLQTTQQETKKEAAAITPTTDGQTGEIKPAEKPSPAAAGKEFVECMRRLQANLTYLAAIADRSHKPSSQIPPHPALISAPQLSLLPSKKKSSPHSSPKQNSNIKNESTASPNDTNGMITADGSEEPENRGQTLKNLYAQLQALFPGVDPKKEPPLPSAAVKNAQQKGQAQSQTQAQKQGMAQMPQGLRQSKIAGNVNTADTGVTQKPQQQQQMGQSATAMSGAAMMLPQSQQNMGISGVGIGMHGQTGR